MGNKTGLKSWGKFRLDNVDESLESVGWIVELRGTSAPLVTIGLYIPFSWTEMTRVSTEYQENHEFWLTYLVNLWEIVNFWYVQLGKLSIIIISKSWLMNLWNENNIPPVDLRNRICCLWSPNDPSCFKSESVGGDGLQNFAVDWITGT